MGIESCDTIESTQTLSGLSEDVKHTIESNMRKKMGIGYDYHLDTYTFPNEPENAVIALKNLGNRAGARIKIPRVLIHEINNYIILRLGDPTLDAEVSDEIYPYISALNEKIDHIR